MLLYECLKLWALIDTGDTYFLQMSHDSKDTRLIPGIAYNLNPDWKSIVKANGG